MISRFKRWIQGLAWTVATVVLVLVAGRAFLADVFRVDSRSMRPTIFGGEDPRTGERFDEHVLVRFGSAEGLERFDLTVIQLDGQRDPMVKRVVGLPGESVGLVGGDLRIDGRRLPPEAHRPAPIPVFDDRHLAVRDYFHFLEGRPEKGGLWWFEDGAWQLDARNGRPDSDQGLMLFHKDLRDDYLSEENRRVVGRHEVNDAWLDCEVRLEEVGGALRFKLVEEGDSYEARLESVADGEVFVVLLHYNSDSLQDPENVRDKITVLKRDKWPFPLATWRRVVFSNVDNNLCLRLYSVEPEAELLHELHFDYKDNEPHAGLTHEGHSSLAARVAYGGVECRAAFRAVRVLRDHFYLPVGEYAVDMPVVLGPDQYFLLGDNSADSKDSRVFGPVSAERILGRPLWVVWPPERWRALEGARPAGP